MAFRGSEAAQRRTIPKVRVPHARPGQKMTEDTPRFGKVGGAPPFKQPPTREGLQPVQGPPPFPRLHGPDSHRTLTMNRWESGTPRRPFGFRLSLLPVTEPREPEEGSSTEEDSLSTIVEAAEGTPYHRRFSDTFNRMQLLRAETNDAPASEGIPILDEREAEPAEGMKSDDDSEISKFLEADLELEGQGGRGSDSGISSLSVSDDDITYISDGEGSLDDKRYLGEAGDTARALRLDERERSHSSSGNDATIPMYDDKPTHKVNLTERMASLSSPRTSSVESHLTAAREISTHFDDEFPVIQQLGSRQDDNPHDGKWRAEPSSAGAGVAQPVDEIAGQGSPLVGEDADEEYLTEVLTRAERVNQPRKNFSGAVDLRSEFLNDNNYGADANYGAETP